MVIKIEKKNLEKAFDNLGDKDETKISGMSKEEEKASSFSSKNEEISFHKGCLNTLVAERNELVKIIVNVEAIMQAHLKRLGELGVKIGVGNSGDRKG